MFSSYAAPAESPLVDVGAAKDVARYLVATPPASSDQCQLRAAIQFLEGGGSEVIITSPPLVREALEGRAGTRIVAASERASERAILA